MKSVKKPITILVLAIFLENIENIFLGSGLSNADQTSYQITKNSLQEETSDKNKDILKQVQT